MYRQPARPKPAHERQARAHGDDENVRARVGLAGHRNLAIPRRAHERIEELARARDRFLLVASQQAAPTVLTGATDPDAPDAQEMTSAPGLDKVSQGAPDPENNESLSPTTEQHGLVRRQGNDIVVSPAAVAKAWADPTWRHDDLAPMRERALDIIRAQREALLDAGDEGLYSADSLEHALNRLDYQEIMLTSDPH